MSCCTFFSLPLWEGGLWEIHVAHVYWEFNWSMTSFFKDGQKNKSLSEPLIRKATEERKEMRKLEGRGKMDNLFQVGFHDFEHGQ